MMVETDNDAADQNVPGQMDDPFKLPAAQQAQVATTLGELMIRLNRLDEALRYLQIARHLEKTPARRQGDRQHDHCSNRSACVASGSTRRDSRSCTKRWNRIAWCVPESWPAWRAPSKRR